MDSSSQSCARARRKATRALIGDKSYNAKTLRIKHTTLSNGMSELPTATLHPGKVVRILVVVAVLLLVANLVDLWMIYVLGYTDVYGLAQLFDFDTEQNVPTYFSGCLFLLNVLLLLSVRQAAKILSKPNVIWLMLAALFLFLGFDELFAVHERLGRPLREAWNLSGIFFFAWVLPYGAAVLLLAMLFLPVWWRLNQRSRFWLGMSAATYLAGALGMEMIGSLYRQPDLLFVSLATIEESLELAGLIMLTYSLLLLLQIEYGGFAVEIPANHEEMSIKPAARLRKIA